MSTQLSPEEWWYGLLTGDNPPLPVRHFRHILKLIPTGEEFNPLPLEIRQLQLKGKSQPVKVFVWSAQT